MGKGRKQQQKKKKQKQKQKQQRKQAQQHCGSAQSGAQCESTLTTRRHTTRLGAAAESMTFADTLGFVRTSAPGCHVSHFGRHSPWVLEAGPIVWEDFGLSGPPEAAAAAAPATASSSSSTSTSSVDPVVDADEPSPVLPDISVDPESHVLTVINALPNAVRVFYVTVFNHRTLGRGELPLERGVAIGQDGRQVRCTTFVLRLSPCSFVDVCFIVGAKIDPQTGMPIVQIESDISTLPWKGEEHSDTLLLAQASSAAAESAVAVASQGAEPKLVNNGSNNCGGAGGQVRFQQVSSSTSDSDSHAGASARGQKSSPCCGNGSAAGEMPLTVIPDTVAEKVYRFPFESGSPPVLCSQGCGGQFTHFYPATFFAIDLECPIGTPLVAIADGVVTEVRQASQVSGISVLNLYKWNSITLRLTDGAVAEYVHILHDSVQVSVGDAVSEGQLLCRSGQAGFCPTPHLHLQVHDSDAPDAPTVPFSFLKSKGSTSSSQTETPQTCKSLAQTFRPQAGKWYTYEGEVSLPRPE